MATHILIGLLTAIIIFLAWFLYQARQRLSEIDDSLKASNKKYDTLNSQKKSSEVRLGLISEQLAPFLEDFEHDPMDLQFLGNPIDYIAFEENAITFIEVKSGKSRLTKSQRQVRDHIKNGRIKWEVFRIE